MADLNLSTLCLACKAIFKAGPDSPLVGHDVPHHSIEALSARAVRGCHLCLTVYMSLDPDTLTKFRRLYQNSQGLASITPIARDQARLKFKYVPEDVGNTQSYHSAATASSSSISGSELLVELILLKPEYAVEPGVKTLDSEAVSTGSDHALQAAKQWLDECSFNHMKCSVSVEPDAMWKPTHLLEVTIKGPKGAPGVKLVDGMFLDPLTEYVTLSHCWGTSKPIRLNKKTLPALRQGVAQSTLPKTFADACYATEQLGLRYLWIDALCIMHDSEALVYTEISQMAKVYSEATVNLAATSSRDDATGLFYTRNIAALQPAVVAVSGHGIDDGVYKVLRSTIWQDLVINSPLNKRAWVFQERCLAKRTIHFTRTEVLFECQQMCCSEVFPRGLPSNGAPTEADDEVFNKRTHHQKTGNWHSLVKMYSRCKLSYSSDKLLALEGLARQYMARNRLRQTDYVVGMWRGQLPAALLWRINQGKSPSRYRAPSWSWTSLDGVVTYPDPQQSHKEYCVEILDIVQKHKTEDPLSQVESASLKIRGFMLKGILLRTHDYWGRTSCVIQAPKSQIEIETAWFDERLMKLSAVNGALTEQLEVYCLPIVDTLDRIEGLLLCATVVAKGAKGFYRRIGTFDISRYDQIAWSAFRENMKGDPTLANYEERLIYEKGHWFASDYTYTINLV